MLDASPLNFSNLDNQPCTSTPVDTRKKANDVPITVATAQLENGAVGHVMVGVVVFKAWMDTEPSRAPAKAAGKVICELNQDQSKLPSHPLESTSTHSIFPTCVTSISKPSVPASQVEPPWSINYPPRKRASPRFMELITEFRN